MPLSIKIISSPPGESISQWNFLFPDEGGNIGRGLGSTLQLSDPLREISTIHAIIKKNTRGYQILDASINGLFINGSDIPLGRENSTTLNDGDILDIGRYRLLASCFLPDQNQVLQPLKQNVEPLIIADPFLERISKVAIDIPYVDPKREWIPMEENELENDPFLNEEISSHQPLYDISLNFNAIEDDPLTGISLDTQYPVTERINNFIDKSFNLSALNGTLDYDLNVQPQIDKSLEVALAQLLDDISPQSMEKVFSELSKPRLWGRKPDYWEMYKMYFNMKIANHDWQIMLKNYFHNAMNIQSNTEDGNK